MELSRVLEETGFPAERLELEITEAYLVYDPDAACKVLKEIRALGVGVSLDDYGTGYASIGFLRKFSFSKVKLDRSLVAEAFHRRLQHIQSNPGHRSHEWRTTDNLSGDWWYRDATVAADIP